MMNDPHQKVQASHLKRNAYVYVRQSTLRQVLENTESTKRQYGLRQRAVALGWAEERVIVIDSDLGQSGASSDREGFQRLVTEVGMGHAGIVLGLEVSRLARNSMDWHRLLEICALTNTLICDEDGTYDASHFNDRLLLGLSTPTSLATTSAAAPSGGSNRATARSLNVCPYRATDFLHRRPQGSWFYEGDNYCDAGGPSASGYASTPLERQPSDPTNGCELLRAHTLLPLPNVQLYCG